MVYHKRYMFDSGRHPDEDFKKPGSVIRSPGRRGSTADHESVDVDAQQQNQDNSGQLVCFFCGFVPSNNNSLEDHIGEDHNDKFKVIILPPVQRPRKRNSELIPVLKGHSCKIIGCDFRSTHLSPSLTEHISHPDPLCRQLRSSQANLAPILSPTLAKVKKRPKPTFRCQKCRFKTHSSKTLHNHSLKKHKSSIQSKLKRDQKLKKKLSSNQDLSGVVQKTSENFQTEPKATEADDRISESVSDETSFNGQEIVNDNCDTSENPILSMQKILESSSSPNDKISETQNLSVNKIFESQNLSSSELSETSNRSETEILETLNSLDQNASNKSDSEILETSNSSDSEILETSIPSDSENLETSKPSEQKIFEIPEPFEKEILETPNLINSEILLEKTSNPQSDSEISKSPEPNEQVFLEALNLQNSEILKTPNLLSSEILVEKTSNPQPDSEISKAPEPSEQEILDCALLENSSVEVESLKSKSNSEADKIQPLTTMPSQDIETKNGSNKLCLRGLEKVNPLKRAASCDQISEDMVCGFLNPQTKRQKLDDQPESGAKPSGNEIDRVGNNSQDHPDQNPVLDLNQPNIANVGAAIEITYQLDSVCVDEESDSNIGGNSKSSSEDENNGEISDMDGPEKLLSALDHSDDSLSSKSTSVIAKESSRVPSTLEETQEELKKKDPDQHQFEVPSNPDHGSSLSRHVGPPHQVVARCDGKRSWADYVMHEHDYPATDSGGELKALEEDLLLSSNEDVSDGFLNFFGNESDIQETANKSNGPNVDTEMNDQNRDTGSSSNKNTSVLETVSITTLGPPEHVSPQPVHEVSPVPEKKVPEITFQNESEIVFEASRNGDSEPETEEIVSTTGKRHFTSEDPITLDLEVENGSSNEYLLTRSRHGSENLFDLHPQPSPRSGESYGGWSHRTLSAKSSTLSDTTWDKHRSAFTSPENMESQDLDDDCVEKKKCLPASSRKRKRCNSPPETSGEDETDEYGNGPATKRMHTPVPEIPRKRKTAKVLNKALKKIVSKNRRAEFSSFGELNFPSLELERNRCLICMTSFKFCSHLKGCRSRRRLQSSSDFGLRHQSRNLLMNNGSFQKRIVVPNPPILIPAASDYVGVDESDIERYEEVTFREGQNNLDSNATDYDISYAATNVNCLATAHFNHVDDQHCSASTSNAAGPSRLGSRSGKRSSGLPVKMSSRRNNQKELEIENVESSAASSTEPPNVRETVESRCNGESGGEPKRVIIKFFSDEKVTTATASKGKGRSNLTVTKKRKVVINGCRVYGTTLMNDINSSPVIDSTLAKPKSKVGNLSLEWDMNVFDRVRAAEASAATTNETCDDAPAPLQANRLPWSQSHFGTTQVRIRSMYQDEDSYSPPHFKMPPRFVYSRTSNVAERQSSRSVDPPTAASTSSDIQSQQPN